MSLRAFVADVTAAEKTLTVLNPTGDVADRIADHFANRNVSVTSVTTEAGPANYVVLGAGDRFVSAVAVDDLLSQPDDLRPGFVRESYRPILDHLDETLFTSYDHRRMLAATREIEDRAWRVGAGELHAGFQVGANLRTQLDSYRRLARRGRLAVHAYVYPEGDPVAADDVQVHLARTDEIRDTWFVVYDGNGVDDYKCALVAEETREGFTGFWTYDSGTVDDIVGHLESAYAVLESDGDGDGGDPSASPADERPA